MTPSASSPGHASPERRGRRRLIRLLTLCVLAAAIVGSAGAATASATVVPAGGDFQATPLTWTTTQLSGTLNTVSATQATQGTNRFVQTQYATPANLLGGGLLGMAATEGVTSPTFTWNQASPQSLTAGYDFGAAFNGLLGVNANAGIGLYLQDLSTNTTTLLQATRITQATPDFTTVSSTVSPSLLVNGDSYRVQVRETFNPLVLVAGSSVIDLDNVGLTATPATPPAPVLSSGSAAVTNVTSSGATVGATIDPGSADTSVRVQYGTTTGYGSTTAAQTLPANSGATAVAVPLAGLAASTTYHAQVIATNSGGSTTSSDLTFTTSAATSGTPAPTISGSGVQGTPGERTATVGTTLNDGGAGSTYYVQYGTTTSYGRSSAPQTNPSGATGATAVTTPLTGLAPGTTYHAQYVVSSPGGTTQSSDFTFTTAALSPPTVATPSASTTSTDGTQETISALVDPGATDTQVTVSYGATSSYGTTTSAAIVPGGSGAQTVSIPLNGLTAGNTYHYSVTATNADGTVSSADATFTPTTQSAPPIGQTSVSAGPGERTVSLTSTINTGGTTGSYYLQYGTTTAYGSQTATQALTASGSPQALTASLTGLTPGTTYHAQFVATVNGHPSSTGADIQFTTAAATPPQITAGPSAATSDSAGTQETISATVDPGADDTQVSVSYGTSSVYGTTTAPTTVPAGSGATSVSFPLSNLTPGTTYHYRLTATNVDGTVNSSDATFTPTASTAPPIGTTAATNGPGQSSVTLGASIDTGGNAGSYVLQYGTDITYGSQTQSTSLTATSGSQPLTGSLTGLAPGTTYHARFVATVNGYPTSYGADYTFTTTAPPTIVSGPTAATTDTAGDQETVSATVDPGGAQTTVVVDYGADSSYGSASTAATVAAGAGAQTVQITLTGLTPGNTYHYAVSATNANGTVSTTDNTFTPTAQSSPPVGATSVTGGPDEHSVSLGSTIDTGGSGGSYVLQYGTDTTYGNQTAPTPLTATNGGQPLSAALTGLASGTTYHVRFVATVNGHPTSYGTDYAFTTAPSSPPAFGTGGTTATPASADGTQETIATGVDPGGHDTSVTVSYGTTSAYGSSAPAASVLPAGSGATTVTVILTGLTPGTTYHYQVNATNVDGTIHTVDRTFTATASTHPPVGPATVGPTGPTSATIGSSVDTGGNGGSYVLQYGPDTGYGSQTPAASLNAASGGQDLSASLTGLAPGTTYHARFVVDVNGYPISDGADFTFTTAPAAADATVASVGVQVASVQVTVDPGHLGTTVSADYGTTSADGLSSGTVTVAGGSGPTTVTLPLTGLTASTTYHLQFVVANSGAATRTGDLTFTTRAADGTGTGTGGGTGTGTTPTPTPTPVSGSGAACVAAYVSASGRTLRMLAVPGAAQVTAGHGLRVALTRRVRGHGAATVTVGRGRAVRISHRTFTITRAQLRMGATTVVRVRVAGRHRATLSLRISTASCGVQLTSARSGRGLRVRLRLPLGAHRVSVTLPRAASAPTALQLTTATGTRTLALTGTGTRLHLRRPAGSLRVFARGSVVVVSGLSRTTTGLALRLATAPARGTVIARVSQWSGGVRRTTIRLGPHRR